MTQVPVVESSVVPTLHTEASMTQVPVVESSVVPVPQMPDGGGDGDGGGGNGGGAHSSTEAELVASSCGMLSQSYIPIAELYDSGVRVHTVASGDLSKTSLARLVREVPKTT